MSWKNESGRHRLSRYGIRTVSKGVMDYRMLAEPKIPPKELYNIDFHRFKDECTYVLGDVDTFNEEYLTVGKKCELTILNTGKRLIKLFWWCSVHNAWEWFDFDEAFSFLRLSLKWWSYNAGLIGVDELEYYSDWLGFADMTKLKNVIDEYSSNLSLKEKIFLFEKAIHLEHESGNVFLGYSLTNFGKRMDMDELRKEFEEKYL